MTLGPVGPERHVRPDQTALEAPGSSGGFLHPPAGGVGWHHLVQAREARPSGDQACLPRGGALGELAWGAGCGSAQVLESRGPGDMAAPRDAEIRKDVQTYYGQVLKKSADLQTSACVTAARLVPKHIREALTNIHEEVALRYYGCGLVIPECLENCWILDLGSGSGRDCYVLSQLVGETGHVTGIDMTESQVEVAKKYIEYHMEKYGFQTPNVTFLHGYIENLEETGIKNESYDIVISNGVINLVPDKEPVLQEAYRVLKHGGELYFSDVYASLELPEEIRTHRILWGECLGGALYWKNLAILAQKIGFCTPRLVTANLITVQNKELERMIGDCRFVSATFRLFKLPKTGPAKRCQVIYNGGITGHEKELIFDANFTFKEGEIVEVDEEMAAILKNSRFTQNFLIRPIGEKLPASSGCSALGSKGVITDPFKLAGESNNANPGCSSDVAGGCCL
ncbi:arsenite methyltransferase isoform X1 [Callorhinus ursinus]|uniref:Arsenite methyltransferase n=2 Tax=Callorhinus ursinus TaxID=34884 RepID=A0A3Q7PSD0_CALUR|nr:arsenite methyltransferase [Callorhinus ursinus]